MAVEAGHLNPFPPQPTQERAMLNHQGYSAAAVYNSQHMRFIGDSLAAALPENQAFYSSASADTSPASRKRARDQLCAFPALQNSDALSLVATGDGLFRIQQFQMDIDSIIADHSKRIRLELAERQKQQAILLAGTIGESMLKKLKEKDDQIQRLGKLNFVLQEKVKSLFMENQLLRDLAQSSEAAANSLRTNLQQVLLQVGGEERAPAEEEVGSCRGSIYDGEEERDYSCDRRCRICGKRESSVLILPCRHLCLCDVCGSGSHHVPACPVCHSSMTANLHINFSNLN